MTALEDRHIDAIALIASGMSIPDTAKRLGFNRVTVYQWTRKPEFQAELRRIQRVKLRAVDAIVRDCATKAAQVLEEIMGDVEASPHARIRAAVEILKRQPTEDEDYELHGEGDMDEWVELKVVK